MSTVDVNVDVAVTGSPSPRRTPVGAATVRAPERRVDGRRAVILVAAIAWSLVAAAEVTGVTRHLGHDALFEGDLPAGTGLGLFLAGCW